MRVRDLIRAFDTREKLPVDVNDVVAYLKAQQIKDEVNFIGVDINTEVMRGAIHHFVIPGSAYREPILCADIYYDKNQGSDWRRLVSCKELLHLLDPDSQKVKSKKDFIRQVEKIVLPTEFQDTISDGAKVVSDRVATYLAVAVLFPLSSRAILMPAFKAEKLTTEDIAIIAEIPERYVALVMSDEWEAAHQIMIA
jgi:hypothetical protein